MNPPLAGMRIVNTRAPHQAAELDSALIAAGAIPLSFPCIAIVPPVDVEPIARALGALRNGEFEWIVFTSGNAARSLAGRVPLPMRVRIAAIGPSTAIAIERELGRSADFISAIHTAQGLADSIPVQPGQRILLPSSEISSPELEWLLIDRGAAVTRITTYRTVTGSGGVDLRSLLATNQVDALTFASPSAVRGLLARFDSDSGSPWARFDLPAVCIGDTTSETATTLGFTSVVAATNQSVEGLVTALVHYVSALPQGRHTWR